MSISQYVIGGTLLVTALAVGYAKWVDQGAKVDKAEARTAIVKAECATNTATDVTETLNRQIEARDRLIAEQRQTISGLTKKANDRLRENNDLRRKIANVQDNPPIPDALELNLDAARLRGAVPRDGSPDSANEDADDGAADTSGRDVPAAAEPTS